MAYGIEDYKKPEVLIGSPEKNLEEYAMGGFGQNTARYNEMNPQVLSAKSSVSAATPWAAGGGSIIPPELQSIIDKIAGSGTTPRQRTDLTHLAGTIGGLEQQRRQEAGAGARLGVMEAGSLERTKLTEAGRLQEANIKTAPALMQAKEETTPTEIGDFGSGFGVGGIKKPSAFDDWGAWKSMYELAK